MILDPALVCRIYLPPVNGLAPLPKEESEHETRSNAVCVKDSPIHGKGLFAARDLAPGEVVVRMDTDSFSTKQHHPWNRRNADILPFFVNHSCSPNAVLVFSPSERAMVVVTAAPIKADEEVTLDYFLLELGGNLIPCRCNAPNCRGSFPVNRKA